MFARYIIAKKKDLLRLLTGNGTWLAWPDKDADSNDAGSKPTAGCRERVEDKLNDTLHSTNVVVLLGSGASFCAKNADGRRLRGCGTSGTQSAMDTLADGRQHWDDVSGARSEDALTWFEATAAVSLDMVRDHLQPGEPFIDIGAGASRLVDVLIEEGFGPITVLDLSAAALTVSRPRLGPRAHDVAWIAADITTWQPERD
ncbi:class I SAM-dependent methyltransferase [Paracoccus spongiarum]|uniref:Class I SAM-dependent methyltransferase n=1 Tax=Paracoccus spongiarum TaxID=3064387 RepID=A0ABT9J7H6_9RHOB|nr:class I SAM-dependent methyltransferase [Paracoccus sp. 2205BS29-5]MDP5305769.1 class I SAM-dependent methyltransferase [Paracoccus sp. 2205BS29-5]